MNNIVVGREEKFKIGVSGNVKDLVLRNMNKRFRVPTWVSGNVRECLGAEMIMMN